MRKIYRWASNAFAFRIEGIVETKQDRAHHTDGIRDCSAFTGDELVTIAHNVAIDWTKKYNYQKLVQDEIIEYDNIEVTKDLREGGIHAQKAWHYWFQYLSERVWQTHFENEIITCSNSVESPRILSLGCGYGGVELSIAKSLRKPYEIIAVDINPHLFKKCRREAVRRGFHVQWKTVDLNYVCIEENAFDVIYAHASLHHMLNLEQVFEQIYKGLKRDGRFIILDIIGKNQVLFWRENVDMATEIVRKMPDRYKDGILDLDTLIRPYAEPSVQVGMEGIRQEEIPMQISKWFAPIKLFKYGSFMRLICTNPIIGKALDPERDVDRKYLEGLFEIDLKLVQEGRLRPTEMFAVFKKK